MSYADDVRREAELRQARRAAGRPLHELPDELERREREKDDRLEKAIRKDCIDRYRANGCVVYDTEQRRKTRGTPGVSDLIVFHHRTMSHWYHEVKAPTGELEPSQRNFKEDCDACGIPYVVGGIEAAEAALDLFVRSRSPVFSRETSAHL
jgi:hypothetical protein